LREGFKDWLQARRLSENTINSYMIHYNLFIREMKKDHRGSDQKYINRFVKRHPTFITSAFLTNLKEYCRENNPDIKFHVPKAKGRKKIKQRKLMSDQEALKIRRWILKKKPYKYVLMFDLTDQCALRRSEVTSIKADDFYWDEWKEGKHCKLKVFSKAKERIVIVPPITMKRLKKFILKNRHKLEGEKTLFFTKQRTWNKIFADARGKTCSYKFTPHDLRRRRATIWINNGLGIENVRIRLGHSTISTTQKYILLDQEDEYKIWIAEN